VDLAQVASSSLVLCSLLPFSIKEVER